MKPIEFYNISVAAAPGVLSEAEYRTVVSRIYYGLHHEACCRYFRVNSQTPYLRKDGSRHKELIKKYRSARNNSISRRIGRLLDDLRILRTKADYDLASLTFQGRPISGASLSAMAVQKGGVLLTALEQYSPGEAHDGCQCAS